MRIGRQLTVTEVYNLITNYNQITELTEQQITNIIQHTSGAIGCLSQLLGIDSNNPPVLALRCSSQTIGHSGWTKIQWDTIRLNNISATLDAEKEDIQVVNSGIFDVTIYINWVSNTTGRRLLVSSGYILPHLIRYDDPIGGGECQQGLNVTSMIKAANDFCFQVYQDSGGNLDIQEAELLISRRSITPFIY